MEKTNLDLEKDDSKNNDTPVTCLGLTFENDEARRADFTEELRKKLQDPEFRKIEGFPIGEDEDILKLSDPPYYTACPNPWIADFIDDWESQKPEKLADYHYHREPFAADVSEGKNDPIYNAHSYHTKVPHKAIMRYILHYTEPGDIVFDGFCGTGMTGVAAQMCGDRDVVVSLGYQVTPDGTILQEETDEDAKKIWKPFSKLGARKAVLNDLSPAATFIAYNYNTPVDIKAFEQEAHRILAEVEEECGWMYKTLSKDDHDKADHCSKMLDSMGTFEECRALVGDNPSLKDEKGNSVELYTLNSIIWSDVFLCPQTANEFSFWDVAMDFTKGKLKEEIRSPFTDEIINKRELSRVWESYYDEALAEAVKLAKQKPSLLVYYKGGKRERKEADAFDIALSKKALLFLSKYRYPTNPLPNGEKMSDPKNLGVYHVHQFYTYRNLYVLSCLRDRIEKSPIARVLRFQFNSCLIRQSRMSRLLVSYFFHGGGGWIGGPISLTLYIPSFSIEVQPFETWKNRTKKTVRGIQTIDRTSITSAGSSTDLNVPDNSLDYLFIDPPFGGNIMYSELNYIWESWLGVLTNNAQEAISSKKHQKTLSVYQQIMFKCFSLFYRKLKPGRWLTCEFSNTKSNVWNSIQTAMQEAGFIVANVSALDKKQGSFNAVTNTTSVKQDLVISAYKPNGGFEERFEQEAQTEEGVWDFIRTHLKYLPVTKKLGLDLVVIPERDPRILYDQVIAYYVRKGYNVSIDSQEFQLGLSQRFSERDGMYFLPEQVAEYDRKKMIGGGRPLQQSLFISDEASAIEWLRSLMRDKPQSFQDINPLFMKEISGWSKNEVGLELSTLLEQNFLPYDGKGPVPDQIHSYLSTNWKDMRNLPKEDSALVAKSKGRWYVPDPNKVGDLEKLREKMLLKEFEEYKEVKKKLKVFRLEAVRAGFKKAWQERDYAIIIKVAEKIPNKVLEEDPKLLMWYDQAVTRQGGD